DLRREREYSNSLNEKMHNLILMNSNESSRLKDQYLEEKKTIETEKNNIIEDNGSSKAEASEAGTYDMNNAPGKKWHEHVDLLEEAIVSNEFDLSKLNVTDGKTDAVSGVTISVQEFVDAVQNALEQAK
ncbi:MAG: FMN-binding protein, partial [Clostridia bacterium]|nr:FMN-binding protein [Clostridia bacterium]